MATETTSGELTRAHGGRLVSRTLKGPGGAHLFSLSGGHLFPIDHGFSEGAVAEADVDPLPDPRDRAAADGDAIERAAALLRAAERPVVMAGTGLYWAHGEDALRALCEELSVPVFLNGLARG